MITDFALMDQLLGAIQSTAPVAVLHGEQQIAGHDVSSDVDLCVSTDPLSIISQIAPDLAESDAFLILVFHYDRGSYSFFFSNSHGTGGAQIDLLHDPAGVGRYGVRTDELLRRRTPGVRWPRVDELDEALYVLRKRQVKRDPKRIIDAQRDVMALGESRAAERARELFSAQDASKIISSSATGVPRAHVSAAIWRSRLTRPSRIRRRCGFWAQVVGEPAPSAARDLARRMNRIIRSSATKEPGVSYLVKHLWRPRLVVSVGARRGWPRPDAVLDASSESPEDLCSNLVSSMHARVLHTYDLRGTS